MKPLTALLVIALIVVVTIGIAVRLIPMIEEWLSQVPVWRYAGIARIVGPEQWVRPAPLSEPNAAPRTSAA